MQVKLVFEIDFEKIEKYDVEKPIFRRGGVKFDPPSVLKGLNCKISDPIQILKNLRS